MAYIGFKTRIWASKFRVLSPSLDSCQAPEANRLDRLWALILSLSPQCTSVSLPEMNIVWGIFGLLGAGLYLLFAQIKQRNEEQHKGVNVCPTVLLILGFVSSFPLPVTLVF